MSASPAPATKRKQSKLKTLFGTGIGNALEWYDWGVYATFAAYFSTQLFDAKNPQSAFLETMAVFAVGFVARPFGGFVFGWLGDRIGRKHSLTFAVLAASVGSLLIAICPTFQQIGWVSSAILVIARLVQGLAHGGELPSAQTYLAEHAPREQRGLFASSIYVTGTAGQLIGLAVGLILQTTLTTEQMDAFGWRLPFAGGAVLGLVALWIRSSMEESEVFEAHKEHVKVHEVEQRNIFADVARNWRVGLKVIGMTCGLTVSYYIWSVTMPSLAKTSFHFNAQDAFTASLIGNFVLMVALPFWGYASDKIGRRPCMLIATIGSAVLFFPMLWLLQGGHMWQLALAISIQLIFLAATLSHAPATYAEMFPTDQRTAGFGIYYAIAIAVFGGTGPYVLTAIGNTNIFVIYAIVLLVITAITIWILPETKGKDLSKHENLEDAPVVA